MSYVNEPVTTRVIRCVIAVHQELGPGFMESVYRRALRIELADRGLLTEAEREFCVFYKGREVGRHRLDFLVERQLIVELKTVESLSRAHYAQVRSYLRATGLKTALLVNLTSARADFRRIEG
jgi:GxxExxY protein